MSYSDELRFLNDLANPDEFAEGHPQSQCPDPAIIAVLAERGTQGDLAVAFWRHVVRCESCADLFNRLRDFQSVAAGADTGEEDDPNWQAVRPRLQLALEEMVAPQNVRPARPPFWKRFSFAGFSQPARFAFASCAMLLIVGISVLSYSLVSTSGRETETAQRAGNADVNPGASADSSRFGGAAMSNSDSRKSGASDIDTAGRSLGGTEGGIRSDGATLPDLPRTESPASLEWSAGDTLRMTVDTVAERAGGTYAVDGRLTIRSADGNIVRFSGTLTPGTPLNTVSIQDLVRDGRPYALAGRQTAQVEIAWPSGIAGIHVAEELDVRLVSGLSLHAVEK